MRDLVIIDNSLIDALLRDQKLVSELPGCLANPPTTRGGAGCNSCGGGALRVEYNQIKTCLAGLDDTHLSILKRHLDAKRIRLIYPRRTPGGKIQGVEHTR